MRSLKSLLNSNVFIDFPIFVSWHLYNMFGWTQSLSVTDNCFNLQQTGPNGLTNHVRLEWPAWYARSKRASTVTHAKICGCTSTDSAQSWHEKKDKVRIFFLLHRSAVSEQNLMCCLSCVHFLAARAAVPLKDYMGDRIDKTPSCLLWGLRCLMMHSRDRNSLYQALYFHSHVMRIWECRWTFTFMAV